MNAHSSVLVLRQVRDGGGREHDVYLAIDGKEITLFCPTAFWSMTFGPTDSLHLGLHLQRAAGEVDPQVSR